MLRESTLCATLLDFFIATPTCLLVSFWTNSKTRNMLPNPVCRAENRPKWHITRGSNFHDMVLRGKSLLQFAPCNTAFKQLVHLRHRWRLVETNFLIFFFSFVWYPFLFKVARNSFLARAAWVADYACSREHTRLTQVQIYRSCTLENFAKFIFRSKISLKVDGENL